MIKADSFFAKALSVLFSFVLLGSIEVAARVAAPRHDRMNEILAILRQDPALIWKVRERIDVLFQGKRVQTNALGLRNAEIRPKEQGCRRIICMGESLTFGWGVDETEAYPRVLERLLRSRVTAGGRIEVINAGQVGYSSFQGLRLFERTIAPLDPDIITVPYVVNDVDKFRFFRSDGRSDRDLLPGSAVLITFDNILRRSALFGWMSAQARRLRGAYGPPPAGAVRVSEKDYEQNLRALVRAARRRGVAVVFLKMPVNLPAAPVIPAGARERSRELLAAGTALLQGGETAAAARTLEKAAALNPYDGDVFVTLGTAYARGKERPAARRAWAWAKECEAYRCRERGDRYNRIMERIAAAENVPLVDVVSLFARYCSAHGTYLFNDPKNDPIHPTPLGHRLIAGELADVIGKQYAAGESGGKP
jgi:lysophospholipase L1-like esterase